MLLSLDTTRQHDTTPRGLFMTIRTIQEIQARLLELAEEKRQEQAIKNRSQLHKDLEQQYSSVEDPAEFFDALNR